MVLSQYDAKKYHTNSVIVQIRPYCVYEMFTFLYVKHKYDY